MVCIFLNVTSVATSTLSLFTLPSAFPVEMKLNKCLTANLMGISGEKCWTFMGWTASLDRGN